MELRLTQVVLEMLTRVYTNYCFGDQASPPVRYCKSLTCLENKDRNEPRSSKVWYLIFQGIYNHNKAKLQTSSLKLLVDQLGCRSQTVHVLEDRAVNNRPIILSGPVTDTGSQVMSRS